MFTPRSSLCAAVLLAVLGTAACSAAPASSGVASLGNGATATSAATPSSGNDFDKMLAFAACMRSHGLKNFPDPTKSGNNVGIQLGKDSGLDPSSAVFQAAQRACQSLMPSGGPDATKADPTKIAPWAACVRSHGVPNLPDPTVVNGAMSLNLDGTGIKPDASQFQNAMAACRSLEPGGGMMVQAGGAPGGGK
ncbi:MAG TPA: hypothetical protein VH333_24050 [Pseudonocardiaceae bacterium]|jgi:hypothetical protein|nr:hypothetical protein [Pseudonocardiaceae bacterium]